MVQTAPTATPSRLAPPGRAARPRAGAVGSLAPSGWRELALIVLFYTGYTLTRLILVQDGTGPAFTHADQILAFERSVGIDVELDLNRMLLEVPWLARAANVFYATAHFAVTLGVVVWVYRRHPAHYRWLRTGIMAATGAALLGFWLYPLAPPRFLEDEGFVDPVTALHSMGLYASDASATLTNQYAAMPSMHAGWALWCGFVLLRLASRRWVRVLGVVYPATTVAVILATANHYVLDAVAGIALTAAALYASRLRYRRTRPERTRRAAAAKTAAAAVAQRQAEAQLHAKARRRGGSASGRRTAGDTCGTAPGIREAGGTPVPSGESSGAR